MMHVSRIKLTNIRCFDKLEITLGNGGMQTVLIGKNGTCKTTILRALAIGLADSKDASGLLPEPTGVLVAEGSSTAEIEIDLADENDPENTRTIKTVIKVDDGQDVLGPKDPTPDDLLVCGYGIGRQTEGGDHFRRYRILDSVYSLFQYEAQLTNTELTLRRLRDFLGTDQYEQTLNGIKRALGLKLSVQINLPQGGGVVISGPEVGASIPLTGWADGYRQSLSWILDAYAWAMKAKCVTSSGGIRGILLLDEVEQHLHPSLQTSFVPRLRKLFPELQIIVTTHSPFVALGVEPEEIVVLKRKGKRVVKEPTIPDFTSYSVEDVVIEPQLFDSPVYRPETEKKLTRYRKLCSKPARERSDKQKAELRKLAAKLASQQIPGVRESPTIKKLDELLKKHNL